MLDGFFLFVGIIFRVHRNNTTFAGKVWYNVQKEAVF